jgi:hypothetical protein
MPTSPVGMARKPSAGAAKARQRDNRGLASAATMTEIKSPTLKEAFELRDGLK